MGAAENAREKSGRRTAVVNGGHETHMILLLILAHRVLLVDDLRQEP